MTTPINAIRRGEGYAVDRDSGELWLYGPIGEGLGGPEADRVVTDLRNLQADRVRVYVNSPGGSVYQGMAIYHALRRDERAVDVRVDGLAASVASVVAMAGAAITVAPGAHVMIHRASALVAGTVRTMEKAGEMLSKMDDSIADVYARRSGEPRATVERWMDDETWFTAAEAVEAGLADEVEEAPVKAVAQFDLSLFKHPPAALCGETIQNEEDLGRRAAAFLLPDPAPLSGNPQQKGKDMPKNAINPDDGQGAEDPKAAERERIDAIRNLCNGEHTDIEAKAIDEGWTREQASEAILQRIRAARPKAPAVASGSRGRDARFDSKAWSAALLHHLGMSPVAEAAYGERLAQQGEDLGLCHVMDLAEAAIRLDGQVEVPKDRMELARAAFSTTSMPTILGGSLDKIVISGYNETPATWASFAKIIPLPNFRPHSTVRPNFLGQAEKVGPDGELKHGSISEDVLASLKLDTFGKILGLARQSLFNDDLGVFTDTAYALGRMARRGVSDLIWSVILANAGDFFHADNGNFLTGTDSALGHDSAATAVAAMRTQRDTEGNDLDILPKVLAVPPELETTARALLESTELHAAEGSPTGNPLKNLADLEVESRLSNSDKFDGTSAKAWYLFSAPASASVVVGFLGGRREPVVEFRGLDQSDAHTLGITWRVFHDYGAALNDHRAAVKAKGES